MDLGLLSVGQLGRRRRKGKPQVVSFDGASYLVGEGVAHYARPIERMDFQRLSNGPELRALLYTALHGLHGPGESQVAILLGLPVEVMAERKLALQTLRNLRGWLMATHHFAVNGEETILTVVAVEAMAQPAGTFFSWGLDPFGKWARSASDLKSALAVADVGFNTTDLFSVRAGEIVARFTGGDTLGIRRAAELLIQNIRAHYGMELSLHEADILLHKRRPIIYPPGGDEVDISPLVRQAMETAGAAILSMIERLWGNGRQFAHLIFTGGGTEALRGRLIQQYPHAVILPQPVLANAIGLSKYAQRENVFPS
jgi:hypothetical protein